VGLDKKKSPVYEELGEEQCSLTVVAVSVVGPRGFFVLLPLSALSAPAYRGLH